MCVQKFIRRFGLCCIKNKTSDRKPQLLQTLSKAGLWVEGGQHLGSHSNSWLETLIPSHSDRPLPGVLWQRSSHSRQSCPPIHQQGCFQKTGGLRLRPKNVIRSEIPNFYSSALQFQNHGSPKTATCMALRILYSLRPWEWKGGGGPGDKGHEWQGYTSGYNHWAQYFGPIFFFFFFCAETWT